MSDKRQGQMPDLKPGERWHRCESLEAAIKTLEAIERMHPGATYTLRKLEGIHRVATFVPRKRGFGPIQWTTWQHGYRDERYAAWEIREWSK